ncbi:MAG: CoA pyrophosphatase [Anaerolineales bacterium]|nr:CoA pyrophosphatase [Anaerolineales bacterium]
MIPLTETDIAERLGRAYQPGVIASTDGYAGGLDPDRLTCAAVLLPLTCQAGEWYLVFTRRTDTVEHHKGQVSFPGGACDRDEFLPEATSLREAEEEIGLRPEDVTLLGRLNSLVTITGFRVTPVVGVIPWPYQFTPEPAEVARVFRIPLSWLADPANWDERPFTPDGMVRPLPVIRYHRYAGEVLWGASARITHDFLTALALK